MKQRPENAVAVVPVTKLSSIYSHRYMQNILSPIAYVYADDPI